MVASVFSSGLNAYQSAQKLMSQGVGGIDSTAATGGAGSFAETLAGFAEDSVASLKKSESISVAAIKGQADTMDVVTAVNSAMRAMETVTALRDKVIGAYQEIIRMPI